MSVIIHPTAIVEKDVQLGENVNIGPFCIIKSGAIIGDNTIIYSNVLIDYSARIGKNNKINHSVVIGTPPQDLKYENEETSVEIGDNNTIREFVTINRGTTATGLTRIGNNCLLMAYCHIAHDCRIGNEIILANAVNMGGHVEIDDFTIIGGITPIHQFVKIGSYSIVGAGLKITKDICPYIMVAGPPATPAGLNVIGLRRRGFSEERRCVLKKAYDILFNSKFNMTEAKYSLIKNFPDNDDVKRIIDFISHSKRGLLQTRNKYIKGDSII